MSVQPNLDEHYAAEFKDFLRRKRDFEKAERARIMERHRRDLANLGNGFGNGVLLMIGLCVLVIGLDRLWEMFH